MTGEQSAILNNKKDRLIPKTKPGYQLVFFCLLFF